jgi:hypothetical protein
MRRIAFFFSMRRVSLLETNQRLSRIVLKIPLLTIFLRKRLSRESCDSPLRKFTEANEITYFPHNFVKNQLVLKTTHARIKNPARDMLKEKPLGNDLLSREVALQVPSALTCLTTGFGMGPGVPTSLKSPRDNFTMLV